MKKKIIVDADTANEIDDLFAITRALFAEEFEMLGLTAAHFRAHDFAPEDSAGASQQLNEDLLRLAGRMDVPCLVGSNQWMGRAWGGEEPAGSPAVEHIISVARSMSEGERLILAGQGAQTNLASAIQLAPDIASKVEIHLMGFRYDVEKGIWNKNEFNIRNDLNAADFLLSHPEVDLHVMPFETCMHLLFPREASWSRFNLEKPLHKYLYDRWVSEDPKGKERVMWDLALIEALIDPSMVDQAIVAAPPENGGRSISMYTGIDVERMTESFWNHLEANT